MKLRFVIIALFFASCKNQKAKDSSLQDRVDTTTQHTYNPNVWSPAEVKETLKDEESLQFFYTLIDLAVLEKERKEVDEMYNKLNFSFQTSFQRFEGDKIEVSYRRDRNDYIKVSCTFDTNDVCMFKSIFVGLDNKNVDEDDIEVYMSFFERLNNHISSMNYLVRCSGEFKAADIFSGAFSSERERECEYNNGSTTYKTRFHISKESETRIRAVSVTISEYGKL